MTEKVSTKDVRARIGDLLNRVSLRHDEFIIERKGKPLAALVPVERLEQMRRYARRHALEFLAGQKGGAVLDGEAMDLANKAKRWTRKRGRKPRATFPLFRIPFLAPRRARRRG
jgi:prevent-host-death family protein